MKEPDRRQQRTEQADPTAALTQRVARNDVTARGAMNQRETP